MNQLPKSRIIGFYSYKGGVGRSMALANTACELAKNGRKVLIIDLDLEAPGQHNTELFSTQFDGGLGPKRGFIEIAQAYARPDQAGVLPNLQDYLFHSESFTALIDSAKPKRSNITRIKGLTKQVSASGSISLLAAGALANMQEYQKVQSGFRFDAWLLACGGFGFFRHLRSECARLGYDDVLVDSRTGLSDPFYLVALELADTLVVISGYNNQNLEGTRLVLDTIASYPIDRRPQHILLAWSPKPTDESERPEWRRKLNQRYAGLGANLDSMVELPYNSLLVYKERLLCLSPEPVDSDYARKIKELIEKLDHPGQETSVGQGKAPFENPFDIIRVDYASTVDLLKYFVDPGETVTRVLNSFNPVMIYGNRGTGKTILAKKHDYLSVLEALGKKASTQDLPIQIGLYLRFDIDLLNSFNTRVEAQRTLYNQLFSNFLDLLIARKALHAIDSFGGVDAWCDEAPLFRAFYVEFGEFSPPESALNFAEFDRYITRHLAKVRYFINNPEQAPPTRLQGNILMKLLVEGLTQDHRQCFGKRWFAVMVDEVEHFEEYQQRTLNSRIKQIKHSDCVTYRYFLRHEGLRTKETVADGQTIQETHDFRTYRLDEDIDEAHFEEHAQNVALKQIALNPYFSSLRLRDLSQLFAEISPEEEARRVLHKSSQPNRLAQELAKCVDVPESFFQWFSSEESLLRKAVALILLHQGKDANVVATAFLTWNKSARDWYHNYHRAALHWMLSLYGANKTYAGVRQLYLLSGSNVRYFLEYCRAIVEVWLAKGGGELPIAVETQDHAIRDRARFYLDDLRGKPRYAEQLLNFVKRLGRIFEAAHRSPRQSQFEINHFSVPNLDLTDDSDLSKWMREARMENVVLRRLGNKQKTLADDRLDDWHLLPCFAPLFNISVRRKKKLDKLPKADLIDLFSADDAEFTKLFSKYQRRYESEPVEDDGAKPLTGSLFDD